MANFDLNALMQDPNFVSGIGLLGAASPRNQGLLQAYQMLRQMEESKREQAESMNMQEYRKAQTQQAAERSRLYGEQVAAQKRAIDLQERGMTAGMDLLKSLDMGGGAPMQPQMQPQQMLPPEPVGKYGTPKRVLDNLKQVESGGNPFAIGPDIGGGVKAQGAFQFLPSTTKMLKDQGLKFDPFNPKEAEDAADFYIQTLVKKHGGDYEAAVAEYGGFKSKDPTNYVSKVMAGSPEKQAQAQSQLQAQADRYKRAQRAGAAVRMMSGDWQGGVQDAIKSTAPDYEPAKIGLQERGVQVQEATEARMGGPELKIKQDAENRLADTAAGEERERKTRIEKTRQQISEEKMKVSQAIQNHETLMDRLATTAKELREHKGLNLITGKIAGSVDPRITSTLTGDNRAIDAAALLGTLDAQSFIQGTLLIRQSSTTGAGVGQQSNEEGQRLTDALAQLTRVQSYESMLKALDRVEKLAEGSKGRIREAYKKGYGEDAPESVRDAPAKSVVRSWQGKSGRTVYEYSDGTKEYAR